MTRQGIWIAIAAVASLSFMGVIGLVTLVRDASLPELTRDPVSLGGLPFEYGIVSRIGIIVWAIPAGIALAAGYVARTCGRAEAPILLGFGVLTVLLLIDDSLVLHESVTWRTGGAPILEAAYGGFLVFLLWRYRAVLLSRTPWLLLAAAIVWFGMSVGMDIYDELFVPGLAGDGFIFVEDTFKFVGIVTWSAYLVVASRRVVIASVRERAHVGA